MSARVHFLDHDCLPSDGKLVLAGGATAWILAAVVAIGVLWTILE